VNALAFDGLNLYVGGSFTSAGGIAATNIARWDGSKWSALRNGLDGSVSALAFYGGTLFVGGTFTHAGVVPVNHVAEWDGLLWFSMGSGMNGNVQAISATASGIFAGGSFTTAGGVPANHIAAWSSNTWSAVGAGTGNGVGGTVLTLLQMAPNALYVGGIFTTAGGLPASNIAQWDGANWTQLGPGIGGGGTPSVNSLIAQGTDLYVGGNFTNAGGGAAARIAKWDGTNWMTLGSGVSRASGNSAVVALGVTGNDLYLGGSFILAGGKASYNFGHWNAQRNFDVPPQLFLAGPQFLPTGQFQFTVTSSNITSYVVEGSQTMSNWVALLTNSAPTLNYQDPDALAFSNRFYRVRQLQ
jgi:hypothetical protein